MNRPLIVIGNGGHASVLTEILLMQGRVLLGFTAPINENNAFGLSYLGSDEVIQKYNPNDIALVMGLGMLGPASTREKVYFQFCQRGYQFETVIHPSAIISPSTYLGRGVQIMAGAIIQTRTIIADNTIINTGSIIDHDCYIAEHVHIAPGTKISGGVRIEKGTHIGVGTTIIQGIQIGKECLIGAGSVVVKNVLNHMKVIGVPAKEVK